jgi:hypothetical protein
MSWWDYGYQIAGMGNTAVMKVETNIIASNTASPVIYVETFKTNAIVFIGNVIVCMTSH